MRLLRVLLALALLLVARDARALLDGVGGYSGPALNLRGLGISCGVGTDNMATLRALVEGGACAGTTCLVPRGCVVWVGSPGAGDSVAELPSNTTLLCEDQTAGFALARKSCSSGSDTPGAACTADNQCHSGTCDPDYPAGTAFAPTEGSTYTVFGAATSSTNVGIVGCSIWTNNASGSPVAIGGSGKPWGYCDGSGGSDVTGEACAVTCDAASGALYGVPCTSSATCGGGTCTENAGTCKTGGGACASVPYATNFSTAGPGKINVIDFSNASGATIRGVTIYDHRRGDQTIKAGTSGQVIDTKADARTLTVPTVANWVGYGINASVTNGLVLGSSTSALRASASGWDAGIVAAGYNIITDCTGGSLGDASQTGWNGSTNLLIQSAGCIVKGFNGGGGLNCIRPSFGGGYNFLVQNAYCDGNIGAKFIVQDSGNQYLGVRGAWGGRGAVVGLGDQRGRCASGTRSGKVCVFGAGDDATIGCPTGQTCAAHDDFPAGSAGHFIIGGGTLLHTDQAGVAFFRTPDSKRCNSGTDAGGPCTTDADCATGACKSLRFTQGSIRDVKFYSGSGGTNTAIDLNTSAVGVDYASAGLGGGPSIEDWTVDLDLSSGFGAGIKFPSNSRICVGGSAAANTSCTADATCTGGGKCESPVKNFVVSGNVSDATTPLTNWDWSYGDTSGLKGLLATDDQGTVVTLTAGAALTRGQLVSGSTGADNTVVVTTTANPERAIGVAMGTAISGDYAKVLTSGIGACIADGTIGQGAKLKPSGSTAGRVVAVSGSSDLIVGTALAAATSGNTFDCLIGTTPPIQNTTAAFPKMTVTQFNSTSSLLACGSGYTQITTVAPSTTSGRTVEIMAVVPVGLSAAGKRNISVSLRRGGTGCADATALPSGSAAVFSQVGSASDNVDVTAVVTEASPSTGSNTYRLCVCADNATGPTVATGSYLRVMEF